MSYEFYKMLHFIGIFLVFLSIGGTVVKSQMQAPSDTFKKLLMINHGVGLLLLLVAGFGLLARLGIGFPGWVIVKIVIWLVLGALVVVIRRNPGQSTIWWYLALAFGFIAAYLAVYKPF